MRQCVKIKNPDDIFLFLSDNKKANDLEKLLEDKDLNLANAQEKINNLINNKKLGNKKEINEIIIGPIEKKTKLVVEFLFNPEFISIGQNVIINDQSLKAYGVITKIFK